MSENNTSKNYSKDQIKEEPPSSAFHPNNLGPVVVVQLARIYDLLMIIARNTNMHEASLIEELHRQGMWACPPVAYRPTENDD